MTKSTLNRSIITILCQKDSRDSRSVTVNFYSDLVMTVAVAIDITLLLQKVQDGHKSVIRCQRTTYLQESGVSYIETQCICDYFTLLDAVSNNVCSWCHLARQSYSECFLLAVHDQPTAEQNTATRRNLHWQITPITNIHRILTLNSRLT